MFSKKYLSSIYAVVTLLLLLQFGKGYASGSKLSGKYIYDADPFDRNVHKLLLEFGFELEDLELLQHFAPERTKEVSFLEQDIVKIRHSTPNGTFSQDFISGREMDEPYLLDKPEYVARTTASLEGDKIVFKRKLAKKTKLKMTELLECHEDGCTSTLFLGDEKVAIHWKRIT